MKQTISKVIKHINYVYDGKFMNAYREEDSEQLNLLSATSTPKEILSVFTAEELHNRNVVIEEN